MATTAAGAALTEGHRLAQIQSLGQLLKLFVREWSPDYAFDPAGFLAWAREFAPHIVAAYSLSADLAARYYAALREAEAVPGPPVTAIVAAPLAESVVEMLESDGPGYAAALRALGMGDDEAARRILTRMMLSTTKTVMGGGRDSLAAHIDADPHAVGYMRVASASCCAFCAMLAGRGPVYATYGLAGGNSQWHNGCKCEPEPVFAGRRPKLPPTSAKYARLWDRVGTGRLNDFRRALERPDVFERKRRERRGP